MSESKNLCSDGSDLVLQENSKEQANDSWNHWFTDDSDWSDFQSKKGYRSVELSIIR